MRTGMLAAAAALMLSGCSSSDGLPTDDDSRGSGAAPSSSAAAEPGEPTVVDDAGELAGQVEAAVPQVGDRIALTEDNDENDLIGRPGQYDQAVFLADERFGCSGPTYNSLSIDCGAKIERWPDAAAAQARVDDIQSKLAEFGLGAEYDYVVGRLVLRVGGDLKPSDAKAYERVAGS